MIYSTHQWKNITFGADIYLQQIPLSAELQHYYQSQSDWNLVLSSGDDYELCFTLAPEKEAETLAALKQLDTPVQCIGEITTQPGIRCHLPDGSLFQPRGKGYEHF